MPVPEHVPEALVCDLSLHRPTAEPFARFTELAGEPLRWTPRADGHWVALDEASAHEVLADARRFSSECIVVPSRARLWPRPLIPEELDPPRHATYRRLVAPHFSPPAVQRLGPELAVLAREQVAGLPLGEEVDLMAALARPLATRSWALAVGLTEEETAALVAAHAGLSDPEGAEAAGAELVVLLEALVARRRAGPGDDVVTAVVGGEVDGRPLRDDEALDFLFLLVLAGLDTVASVLGYLLRHLAETPPLQDRLAAEPEVHGRAVEEALRRWSVVGTARTVTEPTEVQGAALAAGDRVFVPTCVASLDPTVHADPMAYDVDRPPARHLAFGVGPHRCLGSHLARSVLARFLEAIAVVRFVPAGDLSECATGGLVHGMGALVCRVHAPDPQTGDQPGSARS